MNDRTLADNALYGSWRVVASRAVLISADGSREERNAAPDGVLVFTPAHRMIAFTVNPGRTAATNDAEALKLSRSMAAYTGRFTLQPGQYTVHLDFTSTQVALDEPQVRAYEIEGDTLTITVAEHASLFEPGKRNSNVLVLKREK